MVERGWRRKERGAALVHVRERREGEKGCARERKREGEGENERERARGIAYEAKTLIVALPCVCGPYI